MRKFIALLACIAMIIAFSPAVFADDTSDTVIIPAAHQQEWQKAYGKYFADKLEAYSFDDSTLKMFTKDINNDGIPEVFVNWRPHKLNVYTYAGGKVQALFSNKTELGNDSVIGYFKKTGKVGVYNVEKVTSLASSYNVYTITDKGFRKTASVTGYMHLSKKQAQKYHKNSKIYKINGKKSTYTATKKKANSYMNTMTKAKFQSFATLEAAVKYFNDEMNISLAMPLFDNAGYTLNLPKELDDYNITAKTPAAYTENGLTGAATVYSTEKNNVKLDALFTVYKLKGVYTEKTLDKKNPMMVYIGTDGDYTYTYIVAEPDETEINVKTFADLINNYIAHLENYVTLDNAGYTLNLPKALADYNITAKTPTAYTENGLTGAATVYSTEKNNVKLDTLFTVYKLKGVYTEKTLDKKNPMMVYIGTDGGYTYTYIVAEPDETEINVKTFADLINNYIAHLENYVTINNAA